MLGERQTNAGANQDLIALLTRYALANSPAVVIEGMMSSDLYADLLRDLSGAPGVESWFYYFDVPFEETVSRHESRDKAGSFGRDELARWWAEDDLLPFVEERMIDATSSAAESASRIVGEADLQPGALF